MVATRETNLYRRDVHKQGQSLSPKEREKLVNAYLSSSPSNLPSPTAKKWTQPVRDFVTLRLHILVYTFIHLLFSIFIRVRQAYHAVIDKVFAILYYHHRTPELIRRDVKALRRLPDHMSVILELKEDGSGGAGLEGLVDELAEIAAWCTCVGIPFLSVYEKSGILKSYIPTAHRRISKKFHSYFGSNRPTLQMRAPHMPSYLNGDSTTSPISISQSSPGHLSILLLSSDDGRSTLVDLTKTLTEMAQRGKLFTTDISVELVDAEISESVMAEPDLLLLFGPEVELAGYPPWQLRLTEIFHVQDNTEVGYQVFLRALHRYAKAQMRFGR